MKTKLISAVKETQGRDWNYDESTYEVLAITGCTWIDRLKIKLNKMSGRRLR